MPVLQSRRFGDLFVEIHVEIPKDLNKKQRSLLKEFEKETSKSNSPESNNYISRLKKIFKN